MNYENLKSRIITLNNLIGGNWDPEFQLLWILEELGEVSREFLNTKNLPAKSTDTNKVRLAEEIGDVVYGLVSFCESIGIDLLNSLELSVAKFEKRHF